MQVLITLELLVLLESQRYPRGVAPQNYTHRRAAHSLDPLHRDELQSVFSPI
jgi:hypothetical protein